MSHLIKVFAGAVLIICVFSLILIKIIGEEHYQLVVFPACTLIGVFGLGIYNHSNTFDNIARGGKRSKRLPKSGMKYATDFSKMIQFAEAGLSGGNWDGLKMWTEAKMKFPDENTGEWSGPILNKKYSEYRERILAELPEYTADGSMNEPNHFIIQCLRIPFKNKFTVRRLMQVAYNIGQFQAVIHMYDQEYVDEFYRMKLDKLETYFV